MLVKNWMGYLCLLISMPTAAQYSSNLRQEKIVAPNVAALFKTQERPIGTYTGTIPISFPLVSVQSGPFTAALSLDYNSTGGLRVQELGGPIGLGFNLSDGGGKIVQIVRGEPDDRDGILNHGSEIRPSNFFCQESKMADIRYWKVDMEPDQYRYNFNGHSGSFFLKENGEVINMDGNGLKIEYSLSGSSGFDGWTITDESGNKYYFGQRVDTYSSYSSFSGSSPSSLSSASWALYSMTDMNDQHTINFTYTGCSNYFSMYSGGFLPLGPMIGCDYINHDYEQGSVTTSAGDLVLSRIDAENGYITVNSSFVYPGGPKKITAIQAYDLNNNLVKKFTFNYGANYSSYRPKLVSFSEFATSGNDSLTTKFTYDESSDLPDIYSPGMDIWGYANGAGNNNMGLLPSYVNYPIGGSSISNTNLSSRLAGNSTIGLLTKITFPSGGYRQIIYGANKAFPDGDFFMYHPDPSVLAPYMADRSFNETGVDNTNVPYAPMLKHIFKINSTDGGATFNYTLNNPNISCGTYLVKLMELSDSTEMYYGTENEVFTQQATGSKYLANGFYRLDVWVGGDNAYWNCSIDGISGAWQENTFKDSTVSTPYGGFYSRIARNVGGVRVEAVRDYDPATNKIHKTEYRYKMYSFDSTLTSGILVSPVNIIQQMNTSACGCYYPALCPGSSYPLSSEAGSYVVYPEVRTIDSAKGYTDQQFSFAPDYPSTVFPALPTEDMSRRRGKIRVQNYFDKDGNLLKQKKYGYYEFFGTKVQYGYRFKPYWLEGLTGKYKESNPEYPFAAPDLAACNQYGVLAIFWKPASVIELTYTPAGTNADTLIYQYDHYGDYYYVKNEVQWKGQLPRRQRTYRYSFNNSGEFKLGTNAGEQWLKTSLLGKNYFQPLEVVDSARPAGSAYAFTGGSKYIFNKFLPDSAIQLQVYRSYATAGDSVETYFSSYDSIGNVRERYTANNVKEVTIWGYNRSYPVAKVIGSDVATVLSFINPGVINNPLSDAALRTELDKIRTGLASTMAQVITYTYAPLVGITSITDPAGHTVFYEYDLFGRFKCKRDHHGKVLEAAHYKMNNPL